MSANPPAKSEESWKVTLPCTRAEAHAIAHDISQLAVLEPLPVLMTSEPDPDRPDQWRLDAYFETKPDRHSLVFLRSLTPSAKGRKAKVERIEQEDWVTLSQQGLEPIQAGRFFVHTPAHRGSAPAHSIPIEIEAGRAFGTGQHETTSGCLIALDRLKRRGASFSNILDCGTGSGLLAFAAHLLWPTARLAASDIDPVAIEVAAVNARINHVALGRARGRLELAVASGLDHSRLEALAPYDLITANILAGPLIALAPSVAAVLRPGGTLILAGLLDHQAARVAAAYRRQGLRATFRITRGDWPTLVMRKRKLMRPPRRRS
jgi:ribosomal protein L11 methyltransferase